MTRLTGAVAAMLGLLAGVSVTAHANARQGLSYDNDGRIRQTGEWTRPVAGAGRHHLRHLRADRVSVPRRSQVRRVAHLAHYEATVIGGRPAGCPHLYCGCEASLKLFGRIIPELNLAANWLRKFPRVAPAPYMAAARRGHVMVLLEDRGHGLWLVHDGNSGGGRTRIHIRSLRGFAVVDPHATRFAGRPRPVSYSPAGS